jgi:hypothetical protein
MGGRPTYCADTRPGHRHASPVPACYRARKSLYPLRENFQAMNRTKLIAIVAIVAIVVIGLRRRGGDDE